MTQILAVAAGGAVGSVLRYLISRISFLSAFPWSTLLVNMAGSFVLAVLGSGGNPCGDFAGIPRLRVDRAAGWIHHLLHIQSADHLTMASRTVRLRWMERRTQCYAKPFRRLARLATGPHPLTCPVSPIKRINHEEREEV